MDTDAAVLGIYLHDVFGALFAGTDTVTGGTCAHGLVVGGKQFGVRGPAGSMASSPPRAVGVAR